MVRVRTGIEIPNFAGGAIADRVRQHPLELGAAGDEAQYHGGMISVSDEAGAAARATTPSPLAILEIGLGGWLTQRFRPGHRPRTAHARPRA